MSKVSFIIILMLSIIAPVNKGLAQEEAKPENPSPETIGEGFEKAIKKIETERQKAQEELKQTLGFKFNVATEDWLSKKKDERQRGLNQFVEQKWEDLLEFGPKMHYDYYLRDYRYEITRMDVFKTESLTNPYSGSLSVNEILFVEMYHLPSISYREDFLYTVTTPIEVKFGYQQDQFIPTDVGYAKTVMEKGWPESVRTEVFKKIF